MNIKKLLNSSWFQNLVSIVLSFVLGSLFAESFKIRVDNLQLKIPEISTTTARILLVAILIVILLVTRKVLINVYRAFPLALVWKKPFHKYKEGYKKLEQTIKDRDKLFRDNQNKQSEINIIKDELKMCKDNNVSLISKIRKLEGSTGERNLRVNCFNDGVTLETTASITIKGQINSLTYTPNHNSRYRISEEILLYNVLDMLKHYNSDFGEISKNINPQGNCSIELYKEGRWIIPSVFK